MCAKTQERYNMLTQRYESTKAELDAVTADLAAKTARSQVLEWFVSKLKTAEVLEEFDEVLWGDFADYITVDSKKKMTVTFKNGIEATV